MNPVPKFLRALALSGGLLAAFAPAAAIAQTFAQACTAPPPGIVTWLSGDGISRNLVGGGIDGTLTNGATYAAGLSGPAFSFDGVDDFVRLPNEFFDFYAQPAYSIELWFRTTAGGVILGEQAVDALDPGVSVSVPGIYVGTDGVLYVETFWAGSVQQFSSPGLVNDGQWQHVASTYDGQTRRVYVNGTQIGQSNAPRSRYASNLRYQLGTGVGFNRPALPGTQFYSFRGEIDEFTVFNRALTQDEIIAEVNAGASGKCLAALPYLQRSDSPFFAGVQSGTVQLEDCEDGVINLSGATVDAACSNFGPQFTDSVDGDDGVVDGSGSNGRSIYRSAAPITVNFTTPLPSVAGLVWTDLSFQNGVTFQAFDAQNNLVADSFSAHQTVPTNGNTSEDRFFGVRYAPGIARMTISNAGDIEIDHVQFGVNGVPPPPAVGFAPRSGVAPGSVQQSENRVLGGISSGTPISVTGGSYSLNGGAFTSSAGTANNGDRISLRHTAAAQPLTSVTTTLSVAGVPIAFTTTTAAADTTPAPFAFPAANNAALGSTQRSAAVRITGINTATPISVSGGSYSINGRAPTTAAGTVLPNDTVSLSHAAAATPATAVVTQLNIGGVQGSFTSTTVAADTRPDAFGFASQSNVPLSSLRESAPVTIRGINAPAAVSVSGGSYRINGGAYTTAAGSVRAGDTVQLRLTSAATRNTRSSAVLAVGGVSGAFSVTTLP